MSDQTDIIDIQDSLRQSKINLAEIVKETKTATQRIEDLKVILLHTEQEQKNSVLEFERKKKDMLEDFSWRKGELDSELARVNKDITDAKAELSQAWQEKQVLAHVIAVIQKERLRLDGEVRDVQENIKILKKEADVIVQHITAQTEESQKIQGKIKEIIDRKKSMEIEKVSFEEEITIVKKKLEDIKEEYESKATLAFSVAEREIAVTKRENFIKDKYKRAGVPW